MILSNVFSDDDDITLSLERRQANYLNAILDEEKFGNDNEDHFFLSPKLLDSVDNKCDSNDDIYISPKIRKTKSILKSSPKSKNHHPQKKQKIIENSPDDLKQQQKQKISPTVCNNLQVNDEKKISKKPKKCNANIDEPAAIPKVKSNDTSAKSSPKQENKKLKKNDKIEPEEEEDYDENAFHVYDPTRSYSLNTINSQKKINKNLRRIGQSLHGTQKEGTHACHILSIEIVEVIIQFTKGRMFSERIQEKIMREINSEKNLVIKPKIENYSGADGKSGDRYCDIKIKKALVSNDHNDKVIKEINVVNRIKQIWDQILLLKLPASFKGAAREKLSELVDEKGKRIVSPKAEIENYL